MSKYTRYEKNTQKLTIINFFNIIKTRALHMHFVEDIIIILGFWMVKKRNYKQVLEALNNSLKSNCPNINPLSQTSDIGQEFPTIGLLSPKLHCGHTLSQ